jgi:hypothetical protein
MTMTTATAIKAFEVGKTYTCRSICDHECVWSYTIAKRTAATITTTCGKTLRISKRLTNYFGVEMVKPLGDYSMCPVLRAA